MLVIYSDCRSGVREPYAVAAACEDAMIFWVERVEGTRSAAATNSHFLCFNKDLGSKVPAVVHGLARHHSYPTLVSCLSQRAASRSAARVLPGS